MFEIKLMCAASGVMPATHGMNSGVSDSLAVSEALDATVSELIRAATELGLEGVVAMRKASLYESAERSGAWVKYKVNKGQEFVIGGYKTKDVPKGQHGLQRITSPRSVIAGKRTAPIFFSEPDKTEIINITL